jgi:hypothetical protein
LIFSETEQYDIDRPAGFENISMKLIQNDGYYGRNIDYGDSLELTFLARNYKLGHQFERVLQEFLTRYQEGYASVEVKKGNLLVFNTVLDFTTAQTDGKNYIKMTAKINNLKKDIDAKADNRQTQTRKQTLCQPRNHL